MATESPKPIRVRILVEMDNGSEFQACIDEILDWQLSSNAGMREVEPSGPFRNWEPDGSRRVLLHVVGLERFPDLPHWRSAK